MVLLTSPTKTKSGMCCSNEISLADIDMIFYIDQRLRQATGNNAPFGNMAIIFSDDFFQLTPVSGTSIYKAVVKSISAAIISFKDSSNNNNSNKNSNNNNKKKNLHAYLHFYIISFKQRCMKTILFTFELGRWKH